MRIAQIAPLAESVPPKLYGGTERVVAWLVDELVSLGHEVTLFASGDSRTRGNLHPVWPRALRLSRPAADPAAACCAFRRRRPRCPAHGDHVIRSMTTRAAHELDGRRWMRLLISVFEVRVKQ